MKSPSASVFRIVPCKIWTLLFCFCYLSVNGQDTAIKKSNWQFYVEPYLMIPAMKGATGIRNLPDVQVDADAGDIFGSLKIGGMLYAEMQKDRFAISSDIIYMNLQQIVSASTLVANGEINMKQFAWEIAGLYSVVKYWDIGVGARLNVLDAGFNININNIGGGTTNRNQSLSKTWIDPIIITRFKLPVSDKFLLKLRADIGGFGAGSDLAWQIQADAGYRISRLLQLGLGYRVISIDYSKGTGSERFLYDVNTFGPVVRIGFYF